MKEVQRCAAKLLAEWEEAGRIEKMARAKKEERRPMMRASFAVLMQGLRAMGEERARAAEMGREAVRGRRSGEGEGETGGGGGGVHAARGRTG